MPVVISAQCYHQMVNDERKRIIFSIVTEEIIKDLNDYIKNIRERDQQDALLSH
jgi:hypothetical protein